MTEVRQITWEELSTITCNATRHVWQTPPQPTDDSRCMCDATTWREECERVTQSIGLFRTALALSSGTMSYLIGSTKYAEIDVVQRAFGEFCLENPHYENWQKALQVFYPLYQQGVNA